MRVMRIHLSLLSAAQTCCYPAFILDSPVAASQPSRHAGIHPRTQEYIVNKDQVKGHIKEAEGSIKEVTGKIVGNKKLEDKGKFQRAAGKAQAIAGDLKHALKQAE